MTRRHNSPVHVLTGAIVGAVLTLGYLHVLPAFARLDVSIIRAGLLVLALVIIAGCLAHRAR